jgi:hypothetical protein
MSERFVYPQEQCNKLAKIVRGDGGSVQAFCACRPILERYVSLHLEVYALATKPPCPKRVAEAKQASLALKALGHRLSEESQREHGRIASYCSKVVIPYGPRNCFWISVAMFWRNQLGLCVTTGESSSSLKFIMEASRGVRGADELLTENAVGNVIKAAMRK